jgi:transcriptional regulator with XRE-family HTH domain
MDVISQCIVVAGPIPQTATWSTEFSSSQVSVDATAAPLPPDCSPTPEQPLHRLAEVRRREGLTRRAVARRLGVTMTVVQQQEQPSSNISLSDLYQWQKALAVPLTELLSEPEGNLSRPIELRAQLLKAMKTARSLQQRARQASVQRLAQTLIDQIVEIMPELKDITPWPAVGSRRKRHELGQAFFRRFSLDPLDELDGPER